MFLNYFISNHTILICNESRVLFYINSIGNRGFDLDNDIYDGIKIEKLKDTENILTASRATTYRIYYFLNCLGESGGRICCVGFKKGGIVSAVFNLCGDALGPSILSIPYVYYTSGVGLATLINIFGLFFAIASTNMMLRTRLVTMSRSFEDASV